MILLVCLMFVTVANDDAVMAPLCLQVYLQPMTSLLGFMFLTTTNDVSTWWAVGGCMRSSRIVYYRLQSGKLVPRGWFIALEISVKYIINNLNDI